MLYLPNSYRDKGRAKGIKIGKEEGKLEVAKNLLIGGMSISKVAFITGLREEDIEKLASKCD